MRTTMYGKLVLLLLLAVVQNAMSAVYTVSKTDPAANFKTIQAAVNKAIADDEIVITDVAVYEEQVTIDSTKNGLYLHSSDPKAAKKPTIRFQDKVNVGPKSVAESKVEANITFDRNGALQVLGANNVRIEGLAVDGGGVYPFGWKSVWEGNGQTWPLQHGNGGITLWIAGDAIVRYCDISNAYFGINVKDRNIGGVFANPNPSDIDSLNIVPFSGFAKTGNHLIEYNRIHDNSFGMYFESAWDLGTTIRYNLFYENHHPSAKIAADVAALTSEGGNQPGGAIMTKDHLLSPLAIYNNTFWHNHMIFVGIWKAGGQHLVFNNIFSRPEEYHSEASHLDMFKSLANRMHNNVFAAQVQAPPTTANQDIRITNEIQVKKEGDQITKIGTGTIGDDNYSLETKFISTDPDAAGFLEPDWSNALVLSRIVDQGWTESGVKDIDGTPADLGAIPNGRSDFPAIATVRPTVPVTISGTTATISFSILPRVGEIKNPKIVYFALVNKLDTSDVFGNAYKAITTANIVPLTAPAGELKAGSNTIKVTVPSSVGPFAFFEMIIEGEDVLNSRKFTTSVGFIPYRKLDYLLKVVIQDPGKTKTLTTVRAGEPVNIHIEATKSDGTAYKSNINPTVLSLGSLNQLLTPAGLKLDSIPGGLPNGAGDIAAMFTKVPVGGIDNVKAAGLYGDIPFLGASADVRVLAGEPDTIIWHDPPSYMSKLINTGAKTPVLAKVYDKYKNLILGIPVGVKAVSLKKETGDVDNVNGDAVFDTVTGIATIFVSVREGNKGDTFPVVASLVNKPEKKDLAYMIVGDPRDKFRIYYSDTAAYDSSVTLTGCVGKAFPVVIASIKGGKTLSTEKNNTFKISTTSGLTVYKTEAADSAITTATLVGGKVTVWIMGTAKNVAGGTITAEKSGDIDAGSRGGITLNPCDNGVKSATYYADNGRGSVNRLELVYEKPMTAEEVPDSFELFWPAKVGTTPIIARKTDAAAVVLKEPTKITITLATGFVEGKTKIEGSPMLVNSFWSNPKTPGAERSIVPISVTDGVGPLISSAILTERLTAGVDTILVTFTEPIDAEKVKGKTLTLIKGGAPVELTILSAIPQNNQTQVKVVVEELANPPKAGDSLKITAAGTITDAAANHAHPDNRPVVLTLQTVPAAINSATYYDRNVDGTIDAVRIIFNKAVDPKKIFVQLTWQNRKQSAPDFNDATLKLLGTDTVEVSLNDESFGFDDLYPLKTSGEMLVRVKDVDFIKDQQNAKVTDGAAPVISAIEYHEGKFVDDNVFERDTVYVKFTEDLKGVPSPSDKKPFKMIVGSQITEIEVESPIGIDQRKFYRFLVSPAQTQKPSSGDSAWINVEGDPANNVKDQFENVQSNPANRRVAITIILPPFELNIQAGPKPFDPATEAVQFFISPKTSKASSTRYYLRLSIYDKVGNVVKQFPDGTTDGFGPGVSVTMYKGEEYLTSMNKLQVNWNGRNTNGRAVGNGTYVAFFSGVYQSIDVDNKMTQEFNVDEDQNRKVYIAVQH